MSIEAYIKQLEDDNENLRRGKEEVDEDNDELIKIAEENERTFSHVLESLDYITKYIEKGESEDLYYNIFNDLKCVKELLIKQK